MPMIDRPIRIPWVDGPGRTILDCACSLEGDDFHFIIGGFSGGQQQTNEYTQEAKKRGLETVIIKENRSFDINVVRQILSIIKNYEIDIIHTHDFRSDLFGILCSKISKRPVIATVHGWIANDRKGRIYTWLDKLILRLCNHIISVSRRTAKIVTDSGISSDKVIVINNALRIENYICNKSDKSIRSELGVSEDAILIANIGRLSPEKGQLEFLKAGTELLKKYKEVKLLLVGIGADQKMLEEYVSSQGIKGEVFFLGFRKDMVNIYNNINLVVQSSYTEGMPNVILESMLMQVPVIATNVGGTSEIIEHGKTGILIEAGDIDKLAESMQDFISQRDFYESIVSEGEMVIKNHFSHDQRVKKLSDLYCNLVGL